MIDVNESLGKPKFFLSRLTGTKTPALSQQ